MASTTYGSAFAIAPNDAADLLPRVTAIYVGGAGAIAIQNADGSQVIFVAVPVGTILPVSPKRLLATGTTATLLLGLI